MFRFALAATIVLSIGSFTHAQQPPPAQQKPVEGPATKPIDQAALEKEFTERMTNAIMNGQFTMGDRPPKADKYTIVSVRKLFGDNWLISARVQYGDKDFTMPMIILIKWAGDTAVISVTDLGFPGMGTYTARVLIYKDQYAGTWSANGPRAHGGHMWGKIEKAPAEQNAPKAAEPAPKQ